MPTCEKARSQRVEEDQVAGLQRVAVDLRQARALGLLVGARGSVRPSTVSNDMPREAAAVEAGGGAVAAAAVVHVEEVHRRDDEITGDLARRRRWLRQFRRRCPAARDQQVGERIVAGFLGAGSAGGEQAREGKRGDQGTGKAGNRHGAHNSPAISRLSMKKGHTCSRPCCWKRPTAGFSCRLTELEESRLPEADVLVRPEYSTLNYKDGAGPDQPRAGGAQLADGAGHRRRRHGAARARHPDWKPGDRFVHNGWGVGETHWGCLARARAAQGRLAGEAARGLHAAPGDGHRHRRLHRDAVRAGARAPRPAAGRRRGARHRCHRRRRQRGDRAAVQARPPRRRCQRQAAGGRLPERRSARRA